MTVNLVTVSITADPSPADVNSFGAQAPAEGYYIFSPSGTEWPDASGNPIVPMVQQGSLANSTATVSLVASDNFAAGVLYWDVIINIRGLPTINVSQVPVNFAKGATQSIWSILSAAGWSPGSQP